MAERSDRCAGSSRVGILIFISIFLLVLSSLGVNVTAALAGLGIGGFSDRTWCPEDV